MSVTHSALDRVAVYELDMQQSEELRAAWVVAMPHIDRILKEFYDNLERHPKMASMVAGRRAELMLAQKKHWERLFSARFDEAYFESVRRVGASHVRAGLEPTWYISGYSQVLGQLTRIIGRHHRFSGARAARMIGAVTRAVMLDLDVAISVYQETLVREAQERNRRIEGAVAEFEGTMTGLMRGLDDASKSLLSTATALDGRAASTSAKAERIADVQRRTTDGINASATATEELNASIGEIARQAATSHGVARTAVEGARKTSETFAGLAGAAERIGSVISLISEIADQTNLLALNATIESARAGEAGRGFAVVASEVKSLAAQTTRATAEITEQINQIQEMTRRSVTEIQSITRVIDEIASIGSTIASAVEEQGSATREIAVNVQQAAQSAASVDGEVDVLRQDSGETARAAGDVSRLAGELGTTARTLEDSVRAFFGRVRAG